MDDKEPVKCWPLCGGWCVLFFCLSPWGWQAQRAADQIILSAHIGGDIQRTRFVAFLSKKVEYRIFSIADPYRIVVDLPEVEIQVPAEKGRGLILSSRSGLLAAGKSRIVIDLVEPAIIEKAELLPPETRVAGAACHRAGEILAQGVCRGRQNPAASSKGRREPERRRRKKFRRTGGRSSSSILAMAGWMQARMEGSRIHLKKT